MPPLAKLGAERGSADGAASGGGGIAWLASMAAALFLESSCRGPRQPEDRET